MSRKKIHYNVDSRKIIDRIMEKSGLKQFEVATNIFGITDKNLSNKIKRNSIDFFAIIKWIGNEKVDLEYILTGKEPKYTDPPGGNKKEPGRICENTAIYNRYDEDPEIADLMDMTNKVLKSDTGYSASLAANIRSFYSAVMMERRFTTLENRVSSLEKGNYDRIRQGDPAEKKDELIKMRGTSSM